MSNDKATAEAERLRSRWPAEFRDGARCAFLRRYDGDRDEGGYPAGYPAWPLDRRDAWCAGFNRGRVDRARLLREPA